MALANQPLRVFSSTQGPSLNPMVLSPLANLCRPQPHTAAGGVQLPSALIPAQQQVPQQLHVKLQQLLLLRCPSHGTLPPWRVWPRSMCSWTPWRRIRCQLLFL